MRIAYLLAGFLLLGLAVVGAVLPVMPSTVFVILAAGAFARSSPRLERRILEHPVFGPPVVRWRERGAISPGAKALAVAGMSVGFLLFLLASEPSPLVTGLVLLVLLGSAGYVVSRPNR